MAPAPTLPHSKLPLKPHVSFLEDCILHQPYPPPPPLNMRVCTQYLVFEKSRPAVLTNA